MKPTEIIRYATVGVLVVYIVYGVVTMPFPFFLLSAAVGLIAYGLTESVETTAALTILTGALSILISNYKRGGKESFMGGNPVEIATRLQKVEHKQPKAPVGVYASGYVEGFEDVSENKVEAKSTAAESKPAPAAATATTTAPAPPPAAAAVTAAAANPTTTPTTSGFKNPSEPSQDGLFKLGVLPEESKGGFHIDQGTTVLNALNALKPDEVKRMSEDTQKLIDTQKSLMMMLGTMKPMLSDGKQLIDTFQQMFGPAGSQTMPQMSV
jgi:hypothetical protein